jgi:peptidoglycan hydrolase-like amidase
MSEPPPHRGETVGSCGRRDRRDQPGRPRSVEVMTVANPTDSPYDNQHDPHHNRHDKLTGTVTGTMTGTVTGTGLPDGPTQQRSTSEIAQLFEAASQAREDEAIEMLDRSMSRLREIQQAKAALTGMITDLSADQIRAALELRHQVLRGELA